MRIKPFVSSVFLLALIQFPRLTCAQDVDGSYIGREMRARDERINKLSTEEQLKLRAAELKAVEDPEVKAAAEKRDKAIRDFRATLRASMIKADPAVQSIIEKVAIPPRAP